MVIRLFNCNKTDSLVLVLSRAIPRTIYGRPRLLAGREVGHSLYTTEAEEASHSQTQSPKVSRRNGRSDAGPIPYERIPHEEKSDDVVASEILTAALNYVNTLGWNEEALKAGKIEMFPVLVA